ncbi:hypothetical protein IU459_11790 [Nocardia amamiensis]|uniref:DUF4304 domain-containing protein n=1 Tax=Nocardia amamiensis TaxID=404578 RepID=A0ABS0CNS1_9NOCA|nr:hypothetical protein [Nocardia amamiensis]MBF6298222.1 hypothetical protein [Nocardia amamiensis]
MARKFDLERESREFAERMTALLNKTICNGVRLNAVVEQTKKHTVVGYKISKENRDLCFGIPVSTATTCPTYMGVSIRLAPDEDDKYLMSISSVMLLARDEALEDVLFHYDYEREKFDGYPEAHLHVCATSEHWKALGPDRALEKLHLPVGGRRFRPALEDIVEFLIVERFAEGRAGWKQVIADSRHEFQMLQLRAAVRRYPEEARAVLKSLETE